jgi:hypothetical protein
MLEHDHLVGRLLKLLDDLKIADRGAPRTLRDGVILAARDGVVAAKGMIDGSVAEPARRGRE